MSGRFRAVDLAIVGAVILSLVSVGSTLLAVVGAGSQQAMCAVNLSKFGQALASYEAGWGTFPACDPWPMMPQCVDSYCRSFMPPENWDPSHTRLLRQMGYVPIIPFGDPWEVWESEPWGFYIACLRLGMDGIPPTAICPSAILENVMSETSPEIQHGYDQQEASVHHKYAAFYTVNRMLRSPTEQSGTDRRIPRLPGPLVSGDDNQFTTAAVRLDIPPGANIYYAQGVNSDEVAGPAGTLYMCDSRDYRIGNVDLVDYRYGDVDISAGTWMGLHLQTPAAAPLGARHGGKSNVLYVDGHVSDDNQTPRNQRGDLITASTFADFIDEYDIGTQHRLLPGGRWVDQTLSPPGSYAPGDDQAPTVLTTWPADGSTIAPASSTGIRIQFSEQVLINETNVTIDGGAVLPDSTAYATIDASFNLTLAAPLADGPHQVVVSAAVTDRMGNQLDGDADGTGGDAYSFAFTVGHTLTVDPDGGGYPTIQSAIDAAGDGDTITVMPHIYCENIHFDGKRIVLQSTNPQDPAIVAATVIDGTRSGAVVTFDGSETSETVLTGFTICNGLSERSGGGIHGGAPREPHTQATISYCVVVGNIVGGVVDSVGGGMSCCDGPITHCTIVGNWADGRGGGGMYQCYGPISDCLVAGNVGLWDGGGMAHCSGPITRCIVAGNRVGDAQGNGGSGGGMRGCGSVSTCVVAGNSAGAYGGGASGSHMSSSTVVGNFAASNGGGIDDASCRNSIVWGNHAPDDPDYYSYYWPKYSCIGEWSAGAWGGEGNIVVTDPGFLPSLGGQWTGDAQYDPATFKVTLLDDNASWAGGELVGRFVNPDVTQPLQFPVIANTATTLTVWADFRTIDTGVSWVAAGADYEIHDYHLMASSPCINRGDPNSDLTGQTDIDGDPRVVQDRIDIGADEYPDPVPPNRPALLTIIPRPQITLPQMQNNIMRLTFDEPLSLPSGDALSIVELGDPNSDVSSGFTYQLDPDDPNGLTLKATENGAQLSNQTWYRIAPATGFDVHEFGLDMCTLFGDSDGGGRVTTADYSGVKAHLGERGETRYDLNGSGRVTTADYSVVKAYMGDQTPAKP